MEKSNNTRGGKREGAGRKSNKQESVKRGFVLLALGSPMYGKLAANAATSIRFNHSTIPIHLVYSGEALSHLLEAHKALFTSMEVCPEKYITKNGKRNYFKAKTHLYDLSPFDETIVVDADMIFFGGKDFDTLFNELSKVDFTCQNRGVYDFETRTNTGNYTHWCDVEMAKIKYDLSGKIYQLSSEFMYFKKCVAVSQMFALAKRIFNKPLIPSSVEFAGDIPDELAFNIATSKFGIYPRKDFEVFIWWRLMDKHVVQWSEVVQNYLGMSAGGNNISNDDLHRYHSILKHQSKAIGLPLFFKTFPKRRWDANRVNV